MFPEGQRVEIVEGTFAGCEGVVISREEAERRDSENFEMPLPGAIWVVLTFWGREVPVMVASDQVQPI